MKEFWSRVSASVVAILITIGLIVMMEELKNDDDSIPKPPPGYHYCTDEDATGLGFCRNTR